MAETTVFGLSPVAATVIGVGLLAVVILAIVAMTRSGQVIDHDAATDWPGPEGPPPAPAIPEGIGPALTQMQQLTLKPGDILVVHHPMLVTPEQRANLVASFRPIVPLTVQIVVLEAGMTISTLTLEPSE